MEAAGVSALRGVHLALWGCSQRGLRANGGGSHGSVSEGAVVPWCKWRNSVAWFRGGG